MSEIPEDILTSASEAVDAWQSDLFEPVLMEIIAKAILAERQRNQWQDISTAPKDGTPVLVCEGDYVDAAVNYYDSMEMPNSQRQDVWSARESIHQVVCNPTHWQPLPSPPKP